MMKICQKNKIHKNYYQMKNKLIIKLKYFKNLNRINKDK